MTPADNQNLTVRASLNAAISMFTAIANILVGLVVNPLLVSTLGTADFGIWKICQRLLSFVSATEGQSTQGLKWTIAAKQADPDLQAKRRAVGSALIVFLMLVPLVAGAGALVAWYSPSFINEVDSSHYPAIRLTCAILAIGLILMPLHSIPSAVMYGMNRDYQVSWVRAVVMVASGVAMVTCAYLGYGIPGVAAANVIAPILGAIVIAAITKRVLPWLGASLPSREEIKSFFGFSFWILGWKVASRFLFASDVVVLGILTSATTVSAFVLSNYPIHVAEILAFRVITASMPSLGHLLSSGESARAGRVRGEITRMTWLIMVIPGSLILLFCQSFVGLWVGPENFIGQLELLLMVVLCIQSVFIRNDSNIINLTLDIRSKFFIGMAGGAVAFTLAYLMGGPLGLGIPGMLAGLIIGRLLPGFTFPLLLRSRLQMRDFDVKTPLRLFVATGLVLLPSMELGPMIEIDSWLVLIASAGAATPPVIAAVFFLGLSRSARADVKARLGTAAGAAMRRLRRS